ncbi:hypothetical protein PRVXT_000338 [Proteinivorax tanatarense]|uniref:Phage abortive infection protein n=1 Tax=Proteinivorax tanatarense TaxID=1260629 RepID=A0AAU7VMD4_9FIRM
MSNKKVRRWFQNALGFLLVIGLIVVFIYLLVLIWSSFKGLQKEVAAAIVAAVATILVSVFSIVIAKLFERKRAIEQELREKKIPMYEEFIKFWFKVLMSEKTEAKQLSEKNMVVFFSEFTEKLMVWGSDEVVKKWSNYRRLYVSDKLKSDSVNAMFEFERLLMAIRKDMGHKNKDIKKGELLGLFINDIDKYVEKPHKIRRGNEQGVTGK